MKEIAQLHRAKARRETGRWLLEGATLLGEALDAGLSVELVAVGERPQREQHALLERARAAGAELFEVDARAAERLSDRVRGPELFSVVVRPAAWDGALPVADQPALVLGLCGLQDPGNVGTLLRSARAFGACAVLLDEQGADPGSPKILRASAGAALGLPLGAIQSAPELAAAGLELLAAVAPQSEGRAEASAQLAPESLARRSLLLLGHETRGVELELGGLVPRRVGVAQEPGVESLNVAVAGSILMADWYRAQA